MLGGRMAQAWPLQSFVLLLILAWAAGQLSEKHKPDALVEMVPGIDDKVFGKLALYKKNGGVFIEGIIHNLTPGLHGFHVHEEGLLGNKCMDAGEHFNPLDKVHAGPDDLHRHAGDLGNVLADHHGVAKINIFDGHMSLHPGDKTYIGKRSFVVHKKPDDLGRGGDKESLRTGNSGGRLSCGIVIQLGHSLQLPPPVYDPSHSVHSPGVAGFSDGYGKVGPKDRSSHGHPKVHFKGFSDYDYDLGHGGFGQSGSAHLDTHHKSPLKQKDENVFHSFAFFDDADEDPYEEMGSLRSSQYIQKVPAPLHERAIEESYHPSLQDILNFK